MKRSPEMYAIAAVGHLANRSRGAAVQMQGKLKHAPLTALAALFAALVTGAAAQTAPAPATRRPAATAPASQAGRADSVPSVSELKFPPLKPVPIPPVATLTLPNGMKVYLLEDPELPMISGIARIRTGNLFDPPGKVGLAESHRHDAAHWRDQIHNRRPVEPPVGGHGSRSGIAHR